MPNEDARFNTIYYALRALQKKVFGQLWPKQDLDTAISKYHQYIIVELTEALQHTNFKVHKLKHPIDMKKLQEEIVDVFIYTTELTDCVFESPEELLSAVEAKMEKNKTRTDWDINA